MPKELIVCPVCKTEKERYIYEESRIYYCSINCRNIGYKTQMLGEGNPNFGKTWTEEDRVKASERMILAHQNPERRYSSGSANRGRKLSEEVRENMSKAKLGKPGSSHSEKTKEKIGIASRDRANLPETKALMRKRFEENGLWTPLHLQDDYKVYFKESNWIDSMLGHLSSEQLVLFKSVGFFHSRNNTKGLVRDHMFSRRSGFENRVFPEILRHPCNCRLIPHSENVKKKNGRYVDGDVLSLLELFVSIRSYGGSWPEHTRAVEKIQQYESEQRWVNRYKYV